MTKQLSLTIITCILLFHSIGQVGSLDQTFNPIPSSWDLTSITDIVELDNDQVLIAGFLNSNTSLETKNFLVKVNADGSNDNSFSQPTFSRVSSNVSSYGVLEVVVDDLDRIYVCGYFDSVDHVKHGGLARLNPDGTLDPTFNPQSNPYYIQTIALQPDGKLLVGGSFTWYGGTSTSKLARLNQDGSNDNTFTSYFPTGSSPFIWDIEYTSTDNIIATGEFATYDSQARKNIVSLNIDGTLNTNFNVGTGLGSVGDVVREISNGNYFVGGNFTSYNDTLVTNCCVINQQGEIVHSFYNPSIGGNFGIGDVVEDDEGNFYCVGILTNYYYPYGGGSRQFVKFKSDGTLDELFGEFAEVSGLVNTIEKSSNNKIFIGGGIGDYNNSLRKKIVKVNLDCKGDWDLYNGSQYTLQCYDYFYSGPVTPSFQWIDCETNLPLLNDTINYINITENGSYALIITDGYCMDTSKCFSFQDLSVPVNNDDLNIVLFPNPASKAIYLKGIDQLKGTKTINLIDINGKTLMKINDATKEISVSNLDSGIYFITIEHEKGIEHIQFIKE